MIRSSLWAFSLACGVSGMLLAGEKAENAASEVKVSVAEGQFVAVQDGDGLWKVLAHDPKNKVQLVQITDAAGRYSLFEGPDPAGKGKAAKNSHLTHRTLNDPKPMPGGPHPGGKKGKKQGGPDKDKSKEKIEGVLTNLPKDGFIALSNARHMTVIPSDTGKFSVPVKTGKQKDLIFAHFNGKETDKTLKATDVLISRSVGPQSNLALDWTKSVPLAVHTVSVAGIPGGMALEEVGATLFTLNKGQCHTFSGQPTTATTFEFPALAAEHSGAGDFYTLNASAKSADGWVEVYQKTVAGPLTLTLPPLLDLPAPTVAGTEPVRLAYAGISGDLRSRITGEKEGSPKWNVYISKAWLKGQSTYTMPELHKLAGWPEACALPKENLKVTYSTIQQEGETKAWAATRNFLVKP